MRDLKKLDVKEYDFLRIIDVNSNGLIYIDDFDNKCFIDFKNCRRNWVNHVNTSNEYSRNDLSENATKCVGERNICANPIYFEFYVIPRVRFIFKCREKSFAEKLFHIQSKSSKKFLELQFAINKVGWSTFDLT